MIYRRTAHFKKAYQALPEHIRKKAAKAFVLFQENPTHSSLGVKKMQGHKGIWEGRINHQYRFTFHYENQTKTGKTTCVFRNVDNHECLKNP